MKIAIINPPISDFYSSVQRISTLGLQVLESILSRKHECINFDFPSMRVRRTVALPPAINYLKDFIISNEKGPVSFFNAYYHFGPPVEQCAESVIEKSPDLVLIGVFAFAYADTAVMLCNQIKNRYKVPVIMGGAGVTVNPGFFVKNSLADFLFCGEADGQIMSSADYVLGRLNKIPAGLYENKDNDFRNASSAGSFNVPFRASYFGKTLKISTMLSRGCPLKCSFCANYLTLGSKFRTGDYSFLISFLKNIRHASILLNFEDDNICADEHFLKHFVRQLKEIHPDSRIIFENGIDYRLLSEDMLSFLVKSGLLQANFSLGTSGNSEGKAIHRSFSPEKLHTLIEICSRMNVPSVTYFIAGLPGDSTESIAQTVSLLSEWPGAIGYSPYYAVPGIQNCQPDQYTAISDIPLFRGSSMYPWNNNLTSAQLVTLFRFIRIMNCPGKEKKNLKSWFRMNKFISSDGQNEIEVPVPCPDFFERLVSGVSSAVRK